MSPTSPAFSPASPKYRCARSSLPLALSLIGSRLTLFPLLLALDAARHRLSTRASSCTATASCELMLTSSSSPSSSQPNLARLLANFPRLLADEPCHRRRYAVDEPDDGGLDAAAAAALVLERAVVESLNRVEECGAGSRSSHVRAAAVAVMWSASRELGTRCSQPTSSECSTSRT